jgi:predicted  nucleic acid-binding Zn-ribbon protein
MTTIELDQLEDRIQAAVGILSQLREEKRRLEVENGDLRERVRDLETAAGRSADALKPQIKALEEERTVLLDERRVMAKRVEDMLAKLDQLHKAVHA